MDELSITKSPPRRRTYHLRARTLRTELVFGGEVLVEVDGQTVVGPRPVKGFGEQRVALASGDEVSVVARPVPLGRPDVWVRARGRSVPDDETVRGYRCRRCDAQLGALDATCAACGTVTHDLREEAIASQRRTATGTLQSVALGVLLFGVLIVARRYDGMAEALDALGAEDGDALVISGDGVEGPVREEIARLVFATFGVAAAGVCLTGLALLVRRRPVLVFVAAIVIVLALTAVAFLVAPKEAYDALPSIAIALAALYGGLKAAFAAEVDRDA